MSLLVTFFLLSICFSFLCSVLEAVLLSVTPSYTQRLVQEGSAVGKTLDEFKKDIDRPLSAILTLNTIAHTVGAIGVGSQASKVFGSIKILGISAESVVAAFMTLAILVLSEIIPKTIGANNWKRFAPFTARCLKVLIFVLSPFVWMSQHITRALKKNKEESVLSRMDFKAMVQSVEHSGELHQSEFTIINNLLGFEQLTAEDIMTPRNVVTMADENKTIAAFYEKYKHKMTFSRIPLYSDEGRNHISGILLKDQLLQKMIAGEGDRPLSDIRRDVGMVADVTTLPTLFNSMVQNNQHMNIVIDEFGVLRGIVTMEDLIETLFGQEIMDEMDSVSDLQEFARKRWQERAKKLGILENPVAEELVMTDANAESAKAQEETTAKV